MICLKQSNTNQLKLAFWRRGPGGGGGGGGARRGWSRRVGEEGGGGGWGRRGEEEVGGGGRRRRVEDGDLLVFKGSGRHQSNIKEAHQKTD